MEFLNRSDSRTFTWFFVIVLIAIIVMVWVNYWRIQLMYNSSLLSLYTPDSFYISQEYSKEHRRLTILGMKEMESKTIVICSLLRNVAKRLPEIKKRSERLGKTFHDYRIVIVENDSSDETRKLLNEWRISNPRVIILGCGVNSDVSTCHIPQASKETDGHSVNRRRIEKMTHLRNIYLYYIKQNLSDFDFCAVWDMDIIGTIYIDGVANTIGHFSSPSSPAYNADGVCAYGIYRWGILTLYYDTYAHIDHDDSFHINMKTVHDIKKGIGKQYNRGTPPINVKSCFSGFTIYRMNSLVNAKVTYDMSPPDNLECEHVRLNCKLKSIYLNPSMIHFVLLNK